MWTDVNLTPSQQKWTKNWNVLWHLLQTSTIPCTAKAPTVQYATSQLTHPQSVLCTTTVNNSVFSSWHLILISAQHTSKLTTKTKFLTCGANTAQLCICIQCWENKDISAKSKSEVFCIRLHTLGDNCRAQLRVACSKMRKISQELDDSLEEEWAKWFHSDYSCPLYHFRGGLYPSLLCIVICDTIIWKH